MNLDNLSKVLKNEPDYRARQIKKAIFVNLIDSWSQATVLPLALREKLKKECPLYISAEIFYSKDEKTAKALIALSDGLKIESVLMRHKDGRNTACVSSQAGCPLGCLFCATGKSGFKRNLNSSEIAEQVLFFARYLKKQNEKITNIVFLGMGEPFLNYNSVISAIKTLNNREGFNLGARHFSISTVGIVEGIEKLAEEKMEINLAISLHAPNDELRSKIIPVNKKYPITKIILAVDEYIKRTGRRVMFEYIMIKNLNDSDKQALELAKLAKRPLCFLNLISYNATGIFEPSSPKRIGDFKNILEKKGVSVTQRYKFGQEISAACGQLAGRQNCKTHE